MIQTALNHALLQAVEDNDLEMVVQALRAGADINCTDKDGCTPAILAIQLEDRRIYNYLVTHGADLEVVDSFGHTVGDYDGLTIEWVGGIPVGAI